MGRRNMVRKAGGSLKGSSGVVRTKRGKKGGKSVALDVSKAPELTQMQGERLDTDTIRKSIAIQAISTASYGKFDSKVKNQRKSKLKSGKRKKAPVTGHEKKELATANKIADRVLNKSRGGDAGLDMSRAVNMYQVIHDREKQKPNDQTYMLRDQQKKMSKRSKRR